MKSGNRPRLHTRIISVLSVFHILAAALLGLYVITEGARVEIHSQRMLANNFLGLAEPAVIQMLTDRDTRGLKTYLNELGNNPDIASIYFSDAAGSYDYHFSKDSELPGMLTRLYLNSSEPHTILVSDLPRDGNSLGRLEIRLSNRLLNERLEALLYRSLILLGVLVALLIIATFWILRSFTAPLRPLIETVRNFGRGDWEQPVPLKDFRYREFYELGNVLSEGARTMARHVAELEQSQANLKRNEEQLRTIVDNMREVLFELDSGGLIRFLNPAWQQITGYSLTESYGTPFGQYLDDDDDQKTFQPENLTGLDLRSCKMQLKSSSGNIISIELDAHTAHSTDGTFTGIVGNFQDITHRIQLDKTIARHQRVLYKLSITDALTGVFNRRQFDKLISKTLPDSLERDEPVCLVLIDLDGFKFINDTYGHPTGDRALKKVAELLVKMTRPGDTVARLASDEFAVILENTDIQDATIIANTILKAVNETRLSLPVGHLQLQASIGVAVAPLHGTTPQELVGAADVALYQGKRIGRGRVEVLSTDHSEGIREVFSRGFELRNALQAGEIQPSFQPIVDIHSGKPIAYEVLANMRRGRILLPASEFIKVAEDLGLVGVIDLHVIGKALEATPPLVEMFLNISLLSFHNSNFSYELRKLLKPARESGRPITIEITERATFAMTDQFHEEIQSLRDLGCKIALDDFGQGYSTYAYLRRFRPDYIKIEGSFVEGMLDNRADAMIVEHIHGLADAFGAISIAENIEDADLEKAIAAIGIRCGQGYLYGKPAMASDLFTPAGVNALHFPA